jgi:hypothetical protein
MEERMSKQRDTGTNRDSARQMAIAREVMDDDWVVLRALALGDQHPDMDVGTLLKMARAQAMDRHKPA